jgi:hypothetical protein
MNFKRFIFNGDNPSWLGLISLILPLGGVFCLFTAIVGFEKNSEFAETHGDHGCQYARSRQDSMRSGGIPGLGKSAASMFCEDATPADRAVRGVFGVIYLVGGAFAFQRRKDQIR